MAFAIWAFALVQGTPPQEVEPMPAEWSSSAVARKAAHGQREHSRPAGGRAIPHLRFRAIPGTLGCETAFRGSPRLVP